MIRAEEFERLRSLLFAIVYRILVRVSEAEDAFRETWLRYEASPTQPTSTKAFLSAVVPRISIDVLRSARRRCEGYVGHCYATRVHSGQRSNPRPQITAATRGAPNLVDLPPTFLTTSALQTNICTVQFSFV